MVDKVKVVDGGKVADAAEGVQLALVLVVAVPVPVLEVEVVDGGSGHSWYEAWAVNGECATVNMPHWAP